MTMTIGSAMTTQSRNEMDVPVACCRIFMATTLNELPAGVAMPPVTAAMGMPIMRQRPRLDFRGSALAAFRMVSAKPRNRTVQGTSDMTVDTSVVAIMKPKTILRELAPVQPSSALMRRTPHLVLSMMTGSENTAMMNSSAGLAKPPMAWPRFPTMPSTGHMTTMNRAVTPKGSAEVTHRATKASSRPSALTPSAGRDSEPGIKQETTMQTSAIPMPIKRFDMGTLVFSILLLPPC